LPSLVFDDVATGTCRVFEEPVAVIRADDAGEVPAALAQMAERIDAGFHLAGYFGYELGYLLEPQLALQLPAPRSCPLLWFGVFGQPPRELRGDALEHEWQRYRAYAGAPQFEWDEPGYAARFAQVARHIRDGDIYQANLSMRGRFTVVGDPRGLYLALRRTGGGACSAYVDDGTRQVLSFSPELFFDLRADGTITCRPMKGTAPRATHAPNASRRSPFAGDALPAPLLQSHPHHHACPPAPEGSFPQAGDATDAMARTALQSSPKNRAENLMIVDLVRNDLGRIAVTGSVDATRLFEIESYPTVHQMVSTVSATLRAGTSVRRLLEALFPCGSITGAPKIRAMQIIRELEASPRGIYCGAVGWFAPDRSARFNVAIRTLTITGNRGELGVGGGVVADSHAAAEYAECRLKARYFDAARRPLKLIETLRHEAGGYCRLELHLQRLQASAAAFRFPFDRDRVLHALVEARRDRVSHTLSQAPRDITPLRVRLTLDEHGQVEVSSAPLAPNPATWRYRLAEHALDSQDPLLRHKTDWRELHDAERERAARQSGCDEVLFRNERGELCEGSRSNLFIAIGDELLTPTASSGLLEGCLRRELLATGRCREAVLTPTDLSAASQVYFGNSLRGLIPTLPANVEAGHSPFRGR